MQDQFVGRSGADAVTSGAAAHDLFKRLYEQHAGPLLPHHRVLDFGCGWGRVIRFFLKEIEPDNLYGIDINERAIAACQATNRWCRFLRTAVFPPTDFESDSIELVYAYSVFSHLSEDAHERWLEEFSRIITPGGVIILTTFPRGLLELCAKWSVSDPDESFEASRVGRRAVEALGAPGRLAAYDRGEFCYGPHDTLEHFGTTCIPEQYVRQVWSKYFRVLDYVRGADWQDVILCRKD
jgi:SAM-dependent methyltransferase